MVIFPVQSVQQDHTRPSKSHMANKLWDSCLQHQRHLRFKTSYILFLFFKCQIALFDFYPWFSSLFKYIITGKLQLLTTCKFKVVIPQILWCYFFIQGFQTPPILRSLSLFSPVSGVDLPAHYLFLLLAPLVVCLAAVGWREGGGASQLTQSRLSQFTKHNVGLIKERRGQNSPSSLSHLFFSFCFTPNRGAFTHAFFPATRRGAGEDAERSSTGWQMLSLLRKISFWLSVIWSL